MCANLKHGGTAENPKPTFQGLYDTLTANEHAASLCRRIVLGKEKLVKALTRQLLLDWVQRLARDPTNIKRSLYVFYAHSVTSKRKHEKCWES